MSTATGATATRSTSARSAADATMTLTPSGAAPMSPSVATDQTTDAAQGCPSRRLAPSNADRGWRRGSSKASTIPTRRRWESKSAASSERSIPTRVIAVSLYAASPPSSRQTIGLVSSGSTCGWRPAASLAAGGALVWSFQGRRGSRSPRPRPDASYRSGAPAPQPQCGRACGNKFRVKQPPPKQTAKPPDG